MQHIICSILFYRRLGFRWLIAELSPVAKGTIGENGYDSYNGIILDTFDEHR